MQFDAATYEAVSLKGFFHLFNKSMNVSENQPMTNQSSKASFSKTQFSKTIRLRRLSLILLGLTTSLGISVFRVQSAIAIAPLAATISLADAALAQTTEATETCGPGALEDAAFLAFDILQNNRPSSSNRPTDALQALQKPLEIALQKPSSRPQADFLNGWLIERNGLYSPTLLEELAQAVDQPAQSPLLLSTLVQFSQIASRLPPGYSYVKTRSFAAIARQYAALDPSDKQQALQAIAQARQAAQSIQGDIFIAGALIDVAETYVLIDDTASAQAVLAQIEEAIAKIPPNAPEPPPYSSEPKKREILQRLATAYAQTGDIAKAQDIAARVPEQYEDQSNALRGIVAGQIKLQQLSEAEATAQSISSLTQRAFALDALAIAYQNANQPNKAEQLTRQVQQLAETATDITERGTAFESLAKTYLQLGQRDAALQVAKNSPTFWQPELMQLVMTAFRQAGQNDVVESWLAEQLSDVETTSDYWEQQSNLPVLIAQVIATQQFEWISQEWSRIAAISSGFGLDEGQMVEAATAYASTGQTEQAAAWVKQLPLSTRPVLRVKSLAAIALSAYQSGKTDSANSLMEETLQSVDALVADYQSQPSDYPEEASQIKSGAFTTLAVVYSQMGQTDLTSQLLQEIGKTDSSITNPVWSDSGQPFYIFSNAKQYVGALQIAQATSAESTEGKEVRDSQLRWSASSLLQQDRFDLALPVVNQLTQDSSKISLLLAIAQRYGELQQVDTALPFLDKALQLAQTIPGEESQSDYLGADGTTEVPIETDRGSFLEAIALQYAQLKQADQAVQTANHLQEDRLRQQVLRNVQCKIAD